MAKILVVDDNPGNRKLVVALLGHEGHDMIEAHDGADGLQAAQAQLPDLVISDILMPSMDGFEFVRRLRADPGLHNVSVIFYTAHYHEMEARNLAEACRVSRVILKRGVRPRSCERFPKSSPAEPRQTPAPFTRTSIAST
jgi:CheY-like chemotaxis protein